LTNGVLTVGRGENCAVRFDPLTERIASKEHAFIEAKTDGFYLFDNQSRNGTLLNGEKIQNAKLNHGDRIQFGRSGIEATIKIESDSYPSEPTILKTAFQLPNNFQPAPANQFPGRHRTIGEIRLPVWARDIFGNNLKQTRPENISVSRLLYFPQFFYR
jgi:pSer/pThr/pTyr-binding forkhead associated (FHA) protein